MAQQVRRRKFTALLTTLALAVVFGAGYMLSGPISHASGNDGTRPGWGCGDTNHTHTGPPGNHFGTTNPCRTTTGTTTVTTTASTSAQTRHSGRHKHHNRHHTRHHHS